MSGLVCLLPHGYEGQGPEHSSARLERYLQLCAEDNMQVVVCTTPANFFHALRRQLKREFRKPLIAMTPKSMLRNKRAISNLEAFASGTSFHRLLWDHAETHKGEKIKLAKDDKIRRVVVCSGKVYYDLYDEREKRGIDDVYLLRVEQLYPFPIKALVKELSRLRRRRSSGARKSPETWAPGASSSPISNGCSGRSAASRSGPAMPDVRRRRRRRPGSCRNIWRSSKPSSTNAWPEQSQFDMPHYFCKLKPPRTTFISDMTSDEAQLMREHREYWTPRVETGVVIAMGPVADPAGGYGVAIIEAASEAALEAMQGADPVIAAGRGFAYENWRMLGIAVRPSQPLAPINSVSP